MSRGLLEEQIIFPTKPGRDYWAQYRNAQRTFLCAQGKFPNFLDKAVQQILWRSLSDIEGVGLIEASNVCKSWINSYKAHQLYWKTHYFSGIQWTVNKQLAKRPFITNKYFLWAAFCLHTEEHSSLRSPPYRGVVIWHSSKAFYTETTYSPRREWLTMQK